MWIDLSALRSPTFCEGGDGRARVGCRHSRARDRERSIERWLAVSCPRPGRRCGSRSFELRRSGAGWWRELDSPRCGWPRRAAGWSCFPRRPVTRSRRLSHSGASSIQGQTAWVPLAHTDNDPVALMLRLAAALERTGPVDEELLEELSARAPRIDDVALPLWPPSSSCVTRSSWSWMTWTR
jgi:hypothetical protein